MENIISKLNKAFESRIRLGIMSVLMVNDFMDFIGLKDLLNITDGNLASHLKALEKDKYISVSKQFLGRKPNTSYTATPLGKEAFNEHLKMLENLIKSNDQNS